MLSLKCIISARIYLQTLTTLDIANNKLGPMSPVHIGKALYQNQVDLKILPVDI